MIWVLLKLNCFLGNMIQKSKFKCATISWLDGISRGVTRIHSIYIRKKGGRGREECNDVVSKTNRFMSRKYQLMYLNDSNNSLSTQNETGISSQQSLVIILFTQIKFNEKMPSQHSVGLNILILYYFMKNAWSILPFRMVIIKLPLHEPFQHAASCQHLSTQTHAKMMKHYRLVQPQSK